jgi:hypothetical protein
MSQGMFQAFESDGEQSVNIESICRIANREPSPRTDHARTKKPGRSRAFSKEAARLNSND